MCDWSEVWMRVGLGIIGSLYELEAEGLFSFSLFFLLFILFFGCLLFILKFLVNILLNLRVGLTDNAHVLHLSLLPTHTFDGVPSRPLALAHEIKHLRFLSVAVSIGCLFVVGVDGQLGLITADVLRRFN